MRLAPLATLAIVLLTTRAALADDVDKAKAHFAIAARAYEQNQFRMAIDALEEAYRLAPRPSVLFSIAQAYKRQYFVDRQSPDLTKAIAHYRRYLREDPQGKRAGEASQALMDLEPIATRLGLEISDAPPEAKGPRPARLHVMPSVQGATARLDGGKRIALPTSIEVTPGKHTVLIEARGYKPERREVAVGPGESFPLPVPMVEKPALLKLDVDDGVRVYVDGRIAATTPVAKPVEVAPGAHAISLALPGHDPVSMQVDLGRGEARPIAADFSASGQRIGSYVMIGLAVTAAIAGAITTGLAVSEEQSALDIEALATTANITPEQRTDQEDSIARRNLFRGLAFGSFSGAAALGLTGLLMFVLDDREPDALPAPSPSRERTPADKPDMEMGVAPLVGPGEAGVSAVVRF